MAADRFSIPQNPLTEFSEGVRAAIPLIIAIFPFGIVYGTAAVSKGLNLSETVFMSAAIYAGASQMVVLDLVAAPLPFWTILLSVFAVNFRHVLYSASLGHKMGRFKAWQKVLGFFFLIDPQWALCEQRTVQRPLTFHFYLGMGILFYVCWLGSSLAGGLFGRLINDPRAFGLDFAISIYFLAILMSFRIRSNWLAIVLASGLTASFVYWFLGPPWHIASGAFAGMAYALWRGKPAAQLAPAGEDKK